MTPPLSCRYLLLIHIPLYIDRQGQRWLDRLWAVDLYRHTDYIQDLTVGCPYEYAQPPADAVPADERSLRFVEVPHPYHPLVALLRAPLTALQLARLIGRTGLVHSMYGDWWPFATPYLANLIARLRGRFLIVNVESSDWRLVQGEQASWSRRFKARAAEALNRWTISLADLALFTHEGYRRDLIGPDSERGHVIHASWIDEAVVQSDAKALARWQARPAGALRLLFAGRLEESKGVRFMLDAVQRLRRERACAVRLSIIGAGPLGALCREQALLGAPRGGSSKVAEPHWLESGDGVQLELLDPVPYGEAFFALLRGFDAVLVPSVADEQPRIVYDAYSQAVPVLAASTAGLAACVTDQRTGRLFAPADALAIADCVAWAAHHLDDLQAMGMTALAAARSMTHQDMHRQRHALIAAALARRRQEASA